MKIAKAPLRVTRLLAPDPESARGMERTIDEILDRIHTKANEFKIQLQDEELYYIDRAETSLVEKVGHTIDLLRWKIEDHKSALQEIERLEKLQEGMKTRHDQQLREREEAFQKEKGQYLSQINSLDSLKFSLEQGWRRDLESQKGKLELALGTQRHKYERKMEDQKQSYEWEMENQNQKYETIKNERYDASTKIGNLYRYIEEMENWHCCEKEDLVRQHQEEKKDLVSQHQEEKEDLISQHQEEKEGLVSKHQEEKEGLVSKHQEENEGLVSKHQEEKERYLAELQDHRNQIEALNSVLLARNKERPKLLDDRAMKQSLEKLVDQVQQYARLQWTFRSTVWTTESLTHLVGNNQARQKMLQMWILQDTIWVILDDDIFGSPFRVFGIEGRNMDMEWLEACDEGGPTLNAFLTACY
jgi:hypothetical protein